MGIGAFFCAQEHRRRPADAGLAKDREKGYPEKELRLPLW